MTLWRILRTLLPVVAIMGIVSAPLATPAAAAMLSVGQVTAMTDDMPCCPREKPVVPDCQKACPLAALCVAKCFSGLASASAVPNRLGVALAMITGDEAAPDTLAHGPPPRPPQT